MRLYEIEDVILKDLQKMRRKEIEKYHLRVTEGIYGDLINNLYFKEKKMPFQGILAEDFFNSLRDSQDKINARSKNILKGYREGMEKFSLSL